MDKALEAAARAICLHCIGEITEGDLEGYRREAQVAVSAYLAQREADGAVMVPVEATEAMVEAAWEPSDVFSERVVKRQLCEAWAAMLSARPQIEP